MSDKSVVEAFLADWFGRFDRLEPAEAFLPNLHPDVEWDMSDIDPDLHGHARFKAWYASVLDLFDPPTSHDVSEIKIAESTVTFKVRLSAKLKDGNALDLIAREKWHYELQQGDHVVLTRYFAEVQN